MRGPINTNIQSHLNYRPILGISQLAMNLQCLVLRAAVSENLSKMIGKSKNTLLFLSARVLLDSLWLLIKGKIIRFQLRLYLS
jgi:hypothetical protein